MIFRSAALSEDVHISYMLKFIFSLPIPVPNSLLWMSKVGIPYSCLVLLFKVVSLINFFVSSSSRSNHRQISSICFLIAFCNVSLGLIPKKNPMLASFSEL